MVIFPLAPDQTIAQMWSNGARGGNLMMKFGVRKLQSWGYQMVKKSCR